MRFRSLYRAASGGLFVLRFGSAEAFAVKSRTIKTARASFPGGEHLASTVDPTRACLWLFGGGDPVDPISSREGSNGRPSGPSLWGGCESLPQIGRHPWFRFFFLCRRRDLQGGDVTRVCTRSFAQRSVHFEPVASLGVRFKSGSKWDAIDGAFDSRHAPRRQFRAGALWQDKKGPRVGLLGRCRSQQFGAKTDHVIFMAQCLSFSPRYHD